MKNHLEPSKSSLWTVISSGSHLSVIATSSAWVWMIQVKGLSKNSEIIIKYEKVKKITSIGPLFDRETKDGRSSSHKLTPSLLTTCHEREENLLTSKPIASGKMIHNQKLYLSHKSSSLALQYPFLTRACHL